MVLLASVDCLITNGKCPKIITYVGAECGNIRFRTEDVGF